MQPGLLGRGHDRHRGRVGAGFVEPVFTGDEQHPRGSRGPVSASARTLGELDWTTTVEDAQGTVLRTASGRSTGEEPVAVTWDLTDDQGRSVPPGAYLLRLTGSRDGDRARCTAARVVVEGKTCRGTPLQRARCRASTRTTR